MATKTFAHCPACYRLMTSEGICPHCGISPKLQAAIEEAKAALVGNSNDAEHDALVAIIGALGLEIPECDCSYPDHATHADDCPMRAWQKEGK